MLRHIYRHLSYVHLLSIYLYKSSLAFHKVALHFQPSTWFQTCLFIYLFVSMENKNNSPNYSKGACEKILSAIRVSYAFKTIGQISRIRPREKTQNHAKKSIAVQSKMNTPQKLEKPNIVPIEFDDQSLVTLNTYFPVQNKAKVGQNKDQTQVVLQETNKANKKLDLNDTFSEYITRTRNKIRTTASDVGKSTLGLDGVHESKRGESVEHHFSDFIKHAKGKMKSTSFGSRKNISFKRE